jgi:hypothetical protein
MIDLLLRLSALVVAVAIYRYRFRFPPSQTLCYRFSPDLSACFHCARLLFSFSFPIFRLVGLSVLDLRVDESEAKITD